MTHHFWFGMAIILVSGAMNAAFALPMKYSRIWKWENLWLVFSVVGIFMVPWALAFGLVPGLMQVYAGVTPRALFLPLIFACHSGLLMCFDRLPAIVGYPTRAFRHGFLAIVLTCLVSAWSRR